MMQGRVSMKIPSQLRLLEVLMIRRQIVEVKDQLQDLGLTALDCAYEGIFLILALDKGTVALPNQVAYDLHIPYVCCPVHNSKGVLKLLEL
jgi:hypothetical protein